MKNTLLALIALHGYVTCREHYHPKLVGYKEYSQACRALLSLEKAGKIKLIDKDGHGAWVAA